MKLYALGDVNHLCIACKNYLRVYLPCAHHLIYLIEEHHIPIGRRFLAALIALAMVVYKVGKPDVQKVDVRVLLCVVGNGDCHKVSCLGV